MKTTTQVLIALLCFFLPTAIKAQEQYFQISGEVNITNCDTIVIYSYPYYVPLSGHAYQRKELPLKDGKFSYRLDNMDKSARYFNLILRPLIAGREKSLMKDNDIFVARSDDDIFVYIDSLKVNFSGKGYAKYDAFVKMYSLGIKSPLASLKNSTIGDRTDIQNLERYENFHDTIHQRRLSLLDQYALLMRGEEFQILKWDLLAMRKLSFFRPLQSNLSFLGTKDSVIKKIYIRKFREQYDDFHMDTLDTSNKAYSPYYAQYVLLASKYKHILNKAGGKSLSDRDYEEIYDDLKSNLTGLLRDKTLAMYGISNQVQLTNTKVLQTVLDDIQTPYLRNLTYLKLSKGVKGEMIGDFNLQDTSGRKISLRDLKGKVVLIDFWYTGCGGCALLSSQLRDLIKSLKMNQDFRYISVSIDKDRKRWKESVKQGKYTHGSDLDLYTEGLWIEHPIIRHFDILAYPRLILIDREGYIISENLIKKNIIIEDLVRSSLNKP